MIEPGGGRFSYSYDDADRITQLINPQSQRTLWAYDSADRTASKRLANTDRTSYTYDDADEVLRVANVIPGVTTISSFVYKYDPAGNRLRVVEANGDTVTWSYDNVYQLTNEKRSGTNGYNVTHLYDPAGNRLRKNDSGTLTTSTYDAANQLIKQNTASIVTTYSFDANGNQQRTSSGIVTTYTWDFENHLTKIRPSNLLPAINTMTYDGNGKRVRKDDSSGTVKDIWDGANILLETDQNDVTQVIYTLQPISYGNLISQVRGSTSSFYLFDGLGSADRLTDITGQTVTDRYIYKAFGDLQTSSGPTINPFRYVGLQGYYYDSDFIQYLLRKRPFISALGRFVTKDPLGVVGGINVYLYVRNNSINQVDPSGLERVPPKPDRKCCCHKVPAAYIGYGCLNMLTLWYKWECSALLGADRRCQEREGTWQEKCDPKSPDTWRCGVTFAPPLKPPTSPPQQGDACYYPNRLVSLLGGLHWESQCVCQCVGDSPGLNCIRGCIQCSHDSGAPINTDAEQMCQKKCKPTKNELARLSCCLNNDVNRGGCAGTFFLPAPMNPNPDNPECTGMKVP
jgi:RHS repeat-associated protein